MVSAALAYLTFNHSVQSIHEEIKLTSQKYSVGDEDDPYARIEQEFMMLRDPKTNQIPPNIFRRERDFAKNLPKRIKGVLYKDNQGNKTQALTWISRGPNNVGGRSRALGIDIRTNTSPNVTIIAGGVSGGLWRSTNDGSNWSLVMSPPQLHSVTCLVQDMRSGKQDIWYAGSGEAVGNSATGGGSSFFRGDGIFKSTDNGLTWNLIPSTSTNTPQNFDQAFDYVHNIAIDQSNTTQDEIYVAASNVILRSTDGGTSWTTIRGVLSTSFISDVQVTSTGVVYATLPSGNTNAGIWRSTNGTSWTNITPSGFPSTYERIVIGIAPSNENIVYFLGETTGGTSTLGHSLWRYNASGSSWSDRSANIPAFGGSVGDFDSQGSYDLVIKIKPDDPDFVIIGGTNLYRSTNGFTTSGATTWIGGYSPINNVSIYPNQHPDQHSVFFLPGSNLIVYTGHDGGISRTNDITTAFTASEPVSWTSLNNSYHTTQFYSISLAPESGSNAMMGGMQDNGTWFGDAASASDWTFYESGDGTIVEVAPLSDNRVYTAYQLGGVRRRTRAGGFLADFTPNAFNNLFVNPQVLDPNNSSFFYYAGGRNITNAGIWRNSNVQNATSTTGWTYLNSTSIGFSVTAIGISTTNNSNVVYYGSNTGPIRRIDNANTGSSPTVTDIKGSLPNAYVSCIAVDPSNSNNALVVFSNYNIQSLWYTTNGGTSWTDVEGNLAGASGPSVRWATIFYVDAVPHYFLATSVGVYFTILLNGVSTIWIQEAISDIGNVVCVMLDWRDNDGTLAVATHGRGIFTTSITTAFPVELSSFTAKVLKNGGVQLDWRTETEADNYGFEIHRQAQDDEWDVLGFVEGHGNSNSSKQYSYTDINPVGGGMFIYRLKQIDTDGTYEYSDEIKVEIVPTEFALYQNYPNPFNPSTKIRYHLLQESKVIIKLYDILGAEVITLLNEKKELGVYEVEFNAQHLPSGTYIYRIVAGDFVETKKMVLMK
jgi:hypothetical protein